MNTWTKRPNLRLRRRNLAATKHLAVGFFLLCGLCETAFCQYNNLTFEQLSIEHGLSQSIVFSILQDQQGFMWFGTEDGLNKYDGYDFTVLRHNPNENNSLSFSDVRAIAEDRDGVLWIGTFYGGLNRYDPIKQQFTHYFAERGNPKSLSHNHVTAVLVDRTSRLWVGTEAGLDRLDQETGSFVHYPLRHEAGPNSAGQPSVFALCQDRAGGLWVGTDSGLFHLSAGAGHDGESEIVHYRHRDGDERSLSYDVVYVVYEDRAGAIWAGTQQGLSRLDRHANSGAEAGFTRFFHEPGNAASLSHDEVRALYEDEAGVLWIGTNGGGLDLFDSKTNAFVGYVHDPRNPNSLSYNQIFAISQDRSGIIWLGTYGGGANKVKPRQKYFAHYRWIANDPNSLPHEVVWAIYEDAGGTLWIGTHGGGLTRLDRRTNRYHHYQHDPRNPNSLSHDAVRLIHPSHSQPGVLWLGTNGGGLNKFDVGKETFTHYRHDPADATSLGHDELRWILEDRSGELWIGTNGGGLSKMVQQNGRIFFQHYRNDPDDATSLSNDFVRVIYEDPDEAGKYLWLGTQGGGLERFDRRTGTFQHHRAALREPDSLQSDFVFSIYEDRDGIFWLGAWGGGIVRFDRTTSTFRHFTVRDGLSSNQVYGMLEDGAGRFWISSNNGISCFDPQSETFKNYTVDDGLQSNEFNGGAFFKSSAGELFFGGIHGFNAFFPQAIKDNIHRPPVVLTSFAKFNKEAALDTPISQIKKLHLSHADYVFSFEFAALDFTVPMKNRYAYKMEGLDTDWIYTDARRRFATYTTLAPGHYLFRVKGSNNDGLWNEEGVAVRVIIHPPWWQRWWFRGAAALLVLMFGTVLYRRRVKTVRMKAELRAAHDAQMSIMPHDDPIIDGFDISGICLPANEVGGDFYDYLWLDEAQTRFGIVIGDVSGKAMQSAMTAVLASGIICGRAAEGVSVANLVSRMNRPLYNKTNRNMFTALCLADLHSGAQTLTFTNAGLIEPLRKSADAVVALEAAGPKQPLGLLRDNHYQERKVRLQSGDVVVFVTDGVTEERNAAKVFYGEERLKALLQQMDTTAMPAREIKARIIDDVKRFSGASAQQDDMTVVVVKVL